MIKRFFIGFALALLTSSAFSGTETMPVDEIKPGMRGVGRTVFAGDTIDEFGFEVLDIIPNFRSKRDLILVKLVGERVQHTNVVAGMSGSPMYIDGKLIGALSYRMGLFLKDPIAGVTPIDQMLEILERENTRPQELALNRGFNPDYLDMAVGAKPASIQDLIPPYLQASRSNSNSLSEVVPLEVPLFFSGFESSTLGLAESIFGESGFAIYQGGGGVSAGNEHNAVPFEPGSAYSVVLVEGDLGLQATGTVTYVDGDKVIGMGHPFLNSGAVGLPMGKAKILTTISSLMASTKMSALTEVVGTVHQDRATGVMGVSGEVPAMIPVNMVFRSQVSEPVTFNFRIADDRSLYSLTPLIFSIVISNALESARLSSGSQTLRLSGKIHLAGYEPIVIDNYFAGSTPAMFVSDAIQATGEIAATLGALLANNFEEPKIASIDLNFEALHRKYLALVQRIEVNRTVARPGEELTITVYLKEYQGATHKFEHTFKIPEDIRARRINIFAGSGGTLTRLEVRSAPQRFRPKNFQQLLNLLKERRKNNFVFFQIRLPDSGILVQGQELPGLPPSVSAVIKSQKSSGSVASLRDRVLLEASEQTEFAVTGGSSLWLNVEQKTK